jgi:hypothetical protein
VSSSLNMLLVFFLTISGFVTQFFKEKKEPFCIVRIKLDFHLLLAILSYEPAPDMKVLMFKATSILNAPALMLLLYIAHTGSYFKNYQKIKLCVTVSNNLRIASLYYGIFTKHLLEVKILELELCLDDACGLDTSAQYILHNTEFANMQLSHDKCRILTQIDTSTKAIDGQAAKLCR